TPAMVMERVDGQSLRELMQSRVLGVGEVQEILRQSLSALGACHEAGIVHRDLKPGNVLVEERGGELHVKIIDFGLTKITGAGANSVLTAAGEIFGSPRFMAPEQWMGQDVDGRTDLYALGLIGYCLLLGKHFIQPGNPVDVCRAHVQQPRPVLVQDALGQRIPAHVNDALLRATMPVRERRFPDAHAMRAALLGQAPSLERMPRVDVAAEAALVLPPPSDGPMPADDGATLMDDGLAARVIMAARDPSGSFDSGPQAPPVSPRVTLDPDARRDDSLDLATRPVPHEAANAITTIDRAEFEAALRATAEQDRPERPRAPRVLEAPPPPRAGGSHPSRPAVRPVAAPAVAPATAPTPAPAVEDEGSIRPWMLIVAGLVAAGTAAAVVLFLK
ncbi:MAG: protein kinase, partial [bacterium]